MSHRRPADPRNVPNPRGPASCTPPHGAFVMERRPARRAPRAVPALPAPVAAALALGAALVLGAPGEAAAQGVCAGDLPTVPNSNVGGTRIVCQESNPSASGIRINAESVSLSVTSSNFAFRPAIDARLNSASDENDVNVRLGRGLVISTGAAREAFIGAYARNAGSGGTRIVMEDGASITTTGGDADGIRFSNPTAATGTSDVRMTGGSITTSGSEAHGIYILHNGSGASTVSMSGGAIKASGSRSSGIYVNKQRGSGDATITFSGGSIEKSGGDGAGIRFYGNPAANAANARIRVTGGSIAVEGIANTHGVHVDHRGAGGGDAAMTGGSIATKGLNSHGVFATLRNAANEAPVVIGMAGGSITAEGQTALGLYGIHFGLGSVTVTMEGEAEITTSGDGAHGVSALLFNAANEAAIVVGMAGGSVATEGAGAAGLNGLHLGLGSVTVTTGGEAEIESPFFVGVRGWLSNDANAAGRLVVTHGGAVEAGDVGVLAWAARRSGHTSGDGAEEADDAARVAPMIHVTSSGDVTVGASVTDAFIRNRITGGDGTLSAGERAVLDAIKADDSEALTRALEALPADYDDDWKAEAENLRRKRAVLTDDETSANRAAGKILGLTRAGVRALALSHETITGHVRFGDGDDALSPAERTALEAALTGDGLETALAALPAAYTDAWKDTLRAHAASYNAGDIQVDVTGGTIAAEGDGVDARYALAHDRNGAIAVTVADGAEINGGRHGVHVGGAGLAAGGGLRDQTVTVNGEVMGGTGAGVHLAGGGTVTVGRTGRVGATSGDGILSDGAGDLVATVAGTVEGHVRAQGGGDLTVTVEREGEITGDVRAQDGGDLSATVAGTVEGHVRAEGGGDLTVTVEREGEITGDVRAQDGGDLGATVAGTVKGHVRAEGGGDLDATISGTVEGDLRAVDGGALTVDVQEGGAVEGTVHDPAGPLTVAGSIGRLLYTRGGTVTVASTGRLTGVEVEGRREAIRSETGDLTVTVEREGEITGDLRALGGGALTLDVQEGGAVTGTVRDPADPFTVTGSIGRLLYTRGGTVTVASTGRLTGVEVEGRREAIRSEAGDLAVTVAAMGRVTGDLRAMGGGDLTATVSGTVEGDLRALGGGALTVDVQEGGAVKGTVHDPAGPLTVAGSIGRLLYTKGGTVTVASTGRLTGVEIEGRREAVRSEAGDLALSVAGRVEGDVVARGAGEHVVRVREGGMVAGTVRFVGGDNRVEVHEGARIVSPEGSGGRAIANARGAPAVAVRATGGEAASGALLRNEGGALEVLVVAAEEEKAIDALRRIDGGRLYDDHPEAPDVELQRAGEVRGVGRLGTRRAYADGAHDVGWVAVPEREGEFEFREEWAPRSRVYEALPSVLLGLNAPTRYGERRAAGRSAKGGWARVEASRGHWKADGSASREESGVGLAYRHRRHGVQVGLSGAWGEGARVGASLHHRRGSATVEQGGEVALYGTGAGVSGTWSRGEAYLDVQAELTWYEADLTSSSRGVLGKEVSGQGHALGVEAGRRLALSGLPELVLTPRAGLVHSQVDVRGFTDATGSRVRVRDARSFVGRVGVEAEARHGGSPQSRVYGTVDLEHEFETARAAEVSGRRLRSEADATWLRLGLNGVHASEDGGWSFAGGMHYATTSGGGYALGGGLSLGLRF